MTPARAALVALLTTAAGDPTRGTALLADRAHSLCTLCHAIPGIPGPHGDIGPPLAGIGARATPAELRQRIAAPATLNPATIMPTFGPATPHPRTAPQWRGPILTPAEIDDIAAALATMRN